VEPLRTPLGLVAGPLAFATSRLYKLVQVQRFNNAITVMNTFHMAVESGAPTSAALVSDWITNVVPSWKANVCSPITWSEVYAQQILPTQDAITSNAVSGPGTTGTVPLPVVCAGLITWRSAFIGRRRRGRSYIVGLAYGSSGEQGNYYTFSATNVTKMTNIGNAVLNRYTLGNNPSGFQLVVYSRTEQLANPPETWMNAVVPVTRFSVQPYIGTMGSRRSGRGI